jgi:magnesium transporter
MILLMWDEADEDYQLAAGISQDVEADDSIFEHTSALAVEF